MDQRVRARVKVKKIKEINSRDFDIFFVYYHSIKLSLHYTYTSKKLKRLINQACIISIPLKNLKDQSIKLALYPYF